MPLSNLLEFHAARTAARFFWISCETFKSSYGTLARFELCSFSSLQRATFSTKSCCLMLLAINHWHFMAFLISLAVFAGMIPSGDILSPSLSTGGCITKSKWTTASGDGWRDFTGHQHSEIIWNYIAHGAYIICSRVGWPNDVEKHQKHVFLTFNFSSKIWNI